MKIVLLGTAPASMNLAPFGGDWEIWACSPGTYVHGQYMSKFFELHRWEPGQEWFSEGYVKFLETFPGEVIMSAPVESVKNCTLLPYKELVDKYGPYFFTSSLAWMMAMAIEAGATKIALYGVDMAATTEYHDQRMGCQYFAMLAQSMGIEVGVPPESDLLRPAPLYGVCENSHAWIKQTVRARELASRLRQAEQAITDKTNEMHFLRGAMDDQDWNLHSWFGNVDTLGQEFTSPPTVPVINDIQNPRMVVKENGDIEQVPAYRGEIISQDEYTAGKIIRDAKEAGVSILSPENDGFAALKTEGKKRRKLKK